MLGTSSRLHSGFVLRNAAAGPSTTTRSYIARAGLPTCPASHHRSAAPSTSTGLRRSSKGPWARHTDEVTNQRARRIGGARCFSMLPSSLDSTPLMDVNDVASHSASTTDEALTPIASFMDPITDPLSSLFLSMPHPLGYGASVIMLTLAVRTVFTLPVSLWQRKRAAKAKKLVEPEMKIINERLAKELAISCRQRGLGYKEYLAELKSQLAAAQAALHRRHNTHPFITTWAPMLVHIPVFVTFSLAVRKTLEMPNSPVFSETFLWLDKLGEVDPLYILPFAGMLLSFGNAELMGRRVQELKPAVVGGEKGEGVTGQLTATTGRGTSTPSTHPSRPSAQSLVTPRTPAKSTAPAGPPSGLFNNRSGQRPAATRPLSTSSPISASQRRSYPSPPPPPSSSQPSKLASRSLKDPRLVDIAPTSSTSANLSPARQSEIRRNFMAGLLRIGAVGFGAIASQMPAGVTLYWVTSIAYSLTQNFILSVLPRLRKERLERKMLAEAEADAANSRAYEKL
ncbi:hypothetical protein IAU60_002813 [Kwoniella sp. DSM 27419]